MTNRTFCILLAGFLMLMSGAAAAFLRGRTEETGPVRDAALTVTPEEAVMPLNGGEIIQQYGAQYSERYGQWTLADAAVLKPGSDKKVCSPVDGMVRSIVQSEGGACITIAADRLAVELGPLHGLRVFKGSTVERGGELGEAGEFLAIRAEQNGKSIDPMALYGQISVPGGGATGTEG